jgi:peroxiredoxin
VSSKQNSIGNLLSKKIYRYTALITICAALAASGCAANPSTPGDEAAASQVQEAVQITSNQNQPAQPNQSSQAASTKSNPETPLQSLPEQASQFNNQADSPTQSPPADLTLQSAPTELPQPSAAAPVSGEALPPAEPKVGFLAPDLTLTSLDGSAINLSELRGKNVLVNYWVTWCVPCMDELPALQRLSQDYQEQNLVILTVNGIEQDELGKVQQLVTDLGLTTTVMLDENESFWKTYLVQFLPTSFFIDTQGVIRHIMLGSGTEDNIRLKIDQLIANQL